MTSVQGPKADSVRKLESQMVVPEKSGVFEGKGRPSRRGRASMGGGQEQAGKQSR